MGKSNRIRTQRAYEKINAPAVRRKGNDMPSWAMTLITVVVTVAILISVVGILLSANGVFGRVLTSVSSDNFKVSQNMMTYFFNVQYQNFQSNYSSYLSSDTSSGMLSLNPNLPLEDQNFGGEQGSTFYDASILGDFEGTWRDYFIKTTVAEVKRLLIYCEYAKANGIQLTDEDIESIDTTIDSYNTYASYYGYPSADAFIAAQYGEGISTKDVKNCMELSLLANKASTAISEKLDASVLDTDISSRYDANKLTYNVVDYTYYTFTVNYDDIAAEVTKKSDPTDAEIKEKEAEILEAYKTAIEEIRAEAKALAEKTTLEAFQEAIYKKLADDNAKSYYESQTIKDEIKPTIEGVTDIKTYFAEKIAADVLAEILEGKEESEDAVEIPEEDAAETYEVYGVTVKTDYAKIINKVKSSTFTKVLSGKTSYNSEKINYVKDNKVSEWAFGDSAAAGNKYTLNSYDGAKDDGTEAAVADITSNNGRATVTVYYLARTQYRNEELTKNISYMVFSTEADAKAAIEALVAGNTFTKEAFDKVAEEKSASTVESVENYEKGNLGVTDFDTWLYDEATTKGSITSEPVKYTYTSDSTSTTSYIVGFYEADGQAQWHLDVKEDILTEKAEAEAKTLEDTYAVKENDWTYRFIKQV